jgi:hypothetical protein
MPSHSDHTRQLRERRDELKAELGRTGDLRPGSLVERYRRCGKPNCHCAGKDASRHGPQWSLTREVAGKTVTTVIPSGAVEQTRQQLAEYKRFRVLAKAFIEASEQLCDAQLGAPREPAQKGGSRRRSRPRSSARSKSS